MIKSEVKWVIMVEREIIHIVRELKDTLAYLENLRKMNLYLGI